MCMTAPHRHATHPGIVKRLKRAHGHLHAVIGMIEEGRACTDIAVQLQAGEKAVTAAKRTLIHDHIDHCLGAGGEADDADRHGRAEIGSEIVLSQGRFVGRPSKLTVTVLGTPEAIEDVQVGGGVHIVARGRFGR